MAGSSREAAALIAPLICEVLDIPALPVRVRMWDGSEEGPAEGPVIDIRSRRALRRLVWEANELGLARAYVTGEIDVAGDLLAALSAFDLDIRRPKLPAATKRALASAAVRLGAVGLNPAPPAEEVRLRGRLHSLGRDRAAIRHHYDVGNDFYRLLLGDSMTYSCAVWESPDVGLDVAQTAKYDLICRKLGLDKGMRLLDVGCGWGGMVLHAAREYGVEAVGVTISSAQAELARKRVAEAGLTDRVEIRLQDYRKVADGPYDAICSIGMAEHVGAEQMGVYARHLYELLHPRGRLLNHAIATMLDKPTGPTFIGRYVFPDGELLPLNETVRQLEGAGLEVRDVEALREHYALTLRAWLSNLEAHWERAAELAGERRARVWRLYLAVSILGFERRKIGVNQTLCVRTDTSGRSDFPLRRNF
ncbi:MAG: class I SAM-dependent methyltransferase [Mycobacteriales bacterium]